MRIATFDLQDCRATSADIARALVDTKAKVIVLANVQGRDHDLPEMMYSHGYAHVDKHAGYDPSHQADLMVLRCGNVREEPVEVIKYGAHAPKTGPLEGIHTVYYTLRVPLLVNGHKAHLFAVYGDPFSEISRYTQLFDLANQPILRDDSGPVIIAGLLNTIPTGSVPWRMRLSPTASRRLRANDLAHPSALDVLGEYGFPVRSTIPTSKVWVNMVVGRVPVATSHILVRGATIERMYPGDLHLPRTLNRILVADVSLPS